MSQRLTRRRWMQSTAGAGAGVWLTHGYELPAQEQRSANDKLNIALIGVGGKGDSNLNGVAKENVVALCDVDRNRAAKAFGRYPDVPKFDDFRAMLDKIRNIDAVVVSTPDHTHAIAAITAMKMGKHCYCEKPLTHSVYEARMMREVAAKQKVATQMGNQGTSANGLREAVEVIRAGAIGDVREIHVWTNRPIWPQNVGRPADPPPVPEHLSWDLWLGPAPERPYSPRYVPFAWRGFWDFGTGALGDMACHTMNMAYMALRLGAPTTVVADLATTLNPESGPEGCTVTYEFPARGNMPACKLYWYERRKPEEKLLQGQKVSASGSLLIGSKGSMYSPSDYGSSYVLLPEADFKDYQKPNPTLPRSPGHYEEWLRACKGGAPAMSNFVDYAGPFTETVLLGNVAMRVGKKIEWDSAKMQAVGCPEADQFIKREYRRGWTL